MAIDFERELRYRRPGTARLGIHPDGSLVVSAEDIIEVDVAAVNRMLAAEHAMLRRRGQLPDDAPPPAPLDECADGTLTLGHLKYRLVRRHRRRPEVALYERAS